MLRLSDSELSHVTRLIISEAESALDSCSATGNEDGLWSCALGSLWSRVGSLLEPLLFAPVAPDTEASLVSRHGAHSLERTLHLAVLRPLLHQLMLEHELEHEFGARAPKPVQVPCRSLLVRHLLWILYRHRPRVMSSLALTTAHYCSEHQSREHQSAFERLCCRYNVRILVSSNQQSSSPPPPFTDLMNFFLWADLIPRPPSAGEQSHPYGGRFSFNESRYTSVPICEYTYRICEYIRINFSHLMFCI